MSRAAPQPYCFRTREQWGAGVLTRAAPIGASGAISPVQPFARTSRPLGSSRARAPTLDHAGDLYWIDGVSTLQVLNRGEDAPHRFEAPHDLVSSRRLVAGRSSLWAIGPAQQRLERFELDSLQPIQSVPLTGTALDVSDDGRDGVWVLVRANDNYAVLHVDCAGHVCGRVLIPPEVGTPSTVAALRASERITLLVAEGRELAFIRMDGTSERNVQLHMLTPCFVAGTLSGDGSDRIALAGEDPWHKGQYLVFVLDSNGELLDQHQTDAAIQGVAINADTLAIATAKGIELHGASPDDRGREASCVFITPVLHSPETSDERGWSRAEIAAVMRAGASVSVEYAATSDLELVERVTGVAADPALPSDARQAQISRLLDDLWSEPAIMLGSEDANFDEPATYAAPLFAAREPYLWLRVTLMAATGAPIPVMHELRVLYPDRSLLKDLPPNYAARGGSPDFLRKLLGVLDVTAQGLDRTIGSLGSLVHPDTAPSAWLDVLARGLGAPWDDALDEDRKRALLKDSPRILAARGTRAGLDLLLATLFPGDARRFEVIDYTADYDVPRLGGIGCLGARLPMLIGGLPSTAITLNRRAVLGRARLCRNDVCSDPLAQITGRVDVFVTATQSERAKVEAWLERLVRAVLPVTCRLHLHWRDVRPAMWPSVIDSEDGPPLEATPPTRLGVTALLGHTRFPATRPPTLTQDGPDLGPASMS